MIPAKDGKPNPAVVIPRGKVSLSNPDVKSRKLGPSTLDKNPRFTGCPSDDDLLELMRLKLIDTKETDKAKKQGKDVFKQLVSIVSMEDWEHVIRHFVNGKYYECLADEGYCPLCSSTVLDDKVRMPSDAYLGDVIWFETNAAGQPTWDPSGPPKYKVAFAIIGGKKVDKFKDHIVKYGNVPDGIPFETKLVNPEFKDFDVSPYPDRSPVTQSVLRHLCDLQPDRTSTWKPALLEQVKKERLPEKVRYKFLCGGGRLKPAELIAEFKLVDQIDVYREMVGANEPNAHASNYNGSTTTTRVLDATQQPDGSYVVQEPPKPAAKSGPDHFENL